MPSKSESVNVFTVPERIPYSTPEFNAYIEILRNTGGKHDGWEMAPSEHLYYWWAFYPDKRSANKGMTALKKLGFQCTMKHPAPVGAKALFPANMIKKRTELKKRTKISKRTGSA
jgi:hypothetical protein